MIDILRIFERIAIQLLYKHFRGGGIRQWGGVQNSGKPAYILLACSLMVLSKPSYFTNSSQNLYLFITKNHLNGCNSNLIYILNVLFKISYFKA